MKIKYTLITILLLLVFVSISQIFNLPPLKRDTLPIYKSGYFKELDRELEIIIDSFLAIKTMSEPVYAWIFIDDVKKKHRFDIKIYDRKGFQVYAPDKVSGKGNDEIIKIMRSIKPEASYNIIEGKYCVIKPIMREKRCKFCHKRANKNGTIGAITYIRDYDGHIYYSGERIIIFSAVTVLLLMFLFILARWEPGKNIKELFDKS